jgi:hypothetical protein
MFEQRSVTTRSCKVRLSLSSGTDIVPGTLVEKSSTNALGMGRLTHRPFRRQDPHHPRSPLRGRSNPRPPSRYPRCQRSWDYARRPPTNRCVTRSGCPLDTQVCDEIPVRARRLAYLTVANDQPIVRRHGKRPLGHKSDDAELRYRSCAACVKAIDDAR